MVSDDAIEKLSKTAEMPLLFPLFWGTQRHFCALLSLCEKKEVIAVNIPQNA